MATIATLFDREGGLNTIFYKPQDIVPNALAFTEATWAGTIEGDKPRVVVPYVDTPTDTQTVAEGADIAESNATIKEAAIGTAKIAQLAVISNEVGTNGDLLTMLQNALGAAVTDKADQLLLAAPTPDESNDGSTGLYNTTGIIDGGTLTGQTGLAPIVTALGNVAANNGTPTSLIMHPSTWSVLLNLATSDGRPLIAPDVANTPTPQLYGLPVTLNRQAPTGKILINSRAEIIVVASQMNISSSTERYFERDSLGLRLTMRLGWHVIHPDRLAIINVPNPTSAK